MLGDRWPRSSTSSGREEYGSHAQARARELLGDAGNECRVSSPSVWEIGIKSALGEIRGDFSLEQLEQGIDEAGLLCKDVTMRHGAAIAKWPCPTATRSTGCSWPSARLRRCGC